MPLISVIVPIYNAEKFLHKCIDSVLAQTLSDIEILLINDGSTDGSGKICDKLSLEDKRIKVIHQHNQGVSHARNKGIELATGKYIAFIDSDDWVSSQWLEVLHQLMMTNNHTSLAICGVIKETIQGEILYQVDCITNYTINKWDGISVLFKGDQYYRYQGYTCNKLYANELIKEHTIRFNEQIHYNEDRLFNFQYMQRCGEIQITTQPLYHYIIHPDSSMEQLKTQSIDSKMTSSFDAFQLMLDESYNFPQYIRKHIVETYFSDYINMYSFLTHTQKSRFYQKIKTAIKRYRHILPLRQQIPYLLFLFSPALYSSYKEWRWKAAKLKHKVTS